MHMHAYNMYGRNVHAAATTMLQLSLLPKLTPFPLHPPHTRHLGYILLQLSTDGTDHHPLAHGNLAIPGFLARLQQEPFS